MFGGSGGSVAMSMGSGAFHLRGSGCGTRDICAGRGGSIATLSGSGAFHRRGAGDEPRDVVAGDWTFQTS